MMPEDGCEVVCSIHIHIKNYYYHFEAFNFAGDFDEINSLVFVALVAVSPDHLLLRHLHKPQLVHHS